MSLEHWDNPDTKALWTSAMDSMEATLADRVRAGAVVTRGRHDVPEVTIRWSDASGMRNLQFVIESAEWPLSVKFLGHIWRDHGGDREFNTIDFGSVTYASQSDLAARFPADADSAFAQSTGLRLSRAASGD